MQKEKAEYHNFFLQSTSERKWYWIMFNCNKRHLQLKKYYMQMSPIDDSEITTSGVKLQNPGFLNNCWEFFCESQHSQHKWNIRNARNMFFCNRQIWLRKVQVRTSQWHNVLFLNLIFYSLCHMSSVFLSYFASHCCFACTLAPLIPRHSAGMHFVCLPAENSLSSQPVKSPCV